jgi:hypothetical protein
LPTLKRDFLSDSLRESPQKLNEVERQEVERKPESSFFNAFWTPAFAGVTKS